MGKEQIRKDIEKTRSVANLFISEHNLAQNFHNTHTGFLHLDNNENINDITQDIIKSQVNQQTYEKAYSIVLENGHYKNIHDNTGRFNLLSERRGQLAMFDVKTKHLFFDINLYDRINSATFLHNELFMAVAQRKNLFIYDKKGREVHCIRKHKNVLEMEFLQYHFLLASISDNNLLRYLDTSVGKLVAEIVTDENNTCLTKNQTDGVIYLGSEKGHVTLWTPNESKYVAKVFCHQSRVSDVQVERFGNYMVTNGNDKQCKVWDIRKMFKPVNVINTKNICKNIKLSQNNVLATTYKDNVIFYKDIDKNKEHEDDHIALRERFVGKNITGLDFCPFEDVLCVSHNRGISNIIVPGAGDPNFDSYEESPYRSKLDRQNIEVRRLLEKVPYKLIHMNQSIGHLKDR